MKLNKVYRRCEECELSFMFYDIDSESPKLEFCDNCGSRYEK